MRTLSKACILTQSFESLGGYAFQLGSPGNALWPAADDALFIPFILEQPALVKGMFTANGNVAGGNLDVGVYTADGARIVSKGSTAHSGTLTLQAFDLTDTWLSPGQYYMALAMDSTSGTFRRWPSSLVVLQQLGVLKATSAFPLPASVTLATVTAAYLPEVGIEIGKAPIS